VHRAYNSGVLATLYIYIVTASIYAIIISLYTLSSTYDSFVELSFPGHGDKDLPLNIQPLIKFKKSPSGYMVYLPSLADVEALPTTGDGNMREYLGEEISSSLGFIKWTETCYPFRCFLLEIDNEGIIPNLKTRKYSSFISNIGYTNGDRHSWQRYSNVSPIDCYVHVNEADHSVRLLPTEALKPSTVYAIVLLNGVPVVRSDYQSMKAPLLSYWRPGICEDMLIIFRTKKPRQFKIPNADGVVIDATAEPSAAVSTQEQEGEEGIIVSKAENGHDSEEKGKTGEENEPEKSSSSSSAENIAAAAGLVL
jgi:hypothetical protein